MPRGDGTGPMGFGPMTGRAAGYCAGYGVPGFMNPIPGAGIGMGAMPYAGYGAPMGSPYVGYGAAMGSPYAMPFAAGYPAGAAGYGYSPGMGFGRGMGMGFGRGMGMGRGGGFGRGRRFW